MWERKRITRSHPWQCKCGKFWHWKGSTLKDQPLIYIYLADAKTFYTLCIVNLKHIYHGLHNVSCNERKQFHIFNVTPWNIQNRLQCTSSTLLSITQKSPPKMKMLKHKTVAPHYKTSKIYLSLCFVRLDTCFYDR